MFWWEQDKMWTPKLDPPFGLPSKRGPKGGPGGWSMFCTIRLVGVFCLGGILTYIVMVGHAFNAWTNLFIINNLFYARDM